MNADFNPGDQILVASQPPGQGLLWSFGIDGKFLLRELLLNELHLFPVGDSRYFAEGTKPFYPL